MDKRAMLALTTGAVMAFGMTGVADAAAHHHKRHAKRHATAATSTTPTSGSGNTGTADPNGAGLNGSETELTGSTATQADAAALAAVPGGTVDRASAENPSDTSGAAYEVHVTESDGTRVVVLEDSGLEVLSVNASKGGCH